jgi:FkbM family methyltransferase
MEVPQGDHVMLTAMAGWRGVEAIRRAFVVGAHRFEEKDLLFRTYPNLEQVVLFEPLPDCLAELRDAQGGDPRIRIVPCAIAGASGEVVFHVSSNDGLSSSLMPFGTHTRHTPEVAFVRDIAVPARTLEDAMAEHRLGQPDLLFMDVQGAEYAILAAVSPERLAAVKLLFTEVSLEEVYRGGRTLPELAARLGEAFLCCGYAPSRGQKGMHGNALFLNRGFAAAVAALGPSPLLETAAPSPAGDQLAPESAGPLAELLRAELFGALDNPAMAGREVYLWGAGTLGRDLCAVLARQGLRLQGILDNAAGRWGEVFQGLPILRPDPILAREPRPYVLIGTVHGAEVAQQLQRAGFRPGLDFQPAPAIQ